MELIAVVIAQAVLTEGYSDIMEVVSVSYNNEQTSHNTLIKTYILVLCTLDADMILSGDIKRDPLRFFIFFLSFSVDSCAC